MPPAQKRSTLFSDCWLAIKSVPIGTFSLGATAFDAMLTKELAATVISVGFGVFNSTFSTLPFVLMSAIGVRGGFIGILNGFQSLRSSSPIRLRPQ